MSWNQTEVLEARRAIFEAARAILSGTLCPIEGARIAVGRRVAAKLEDDPDMLLLVGIASETETLPIGDERRLWNAQALADLEPKIRDAQDWAARVGRSHWQSLLDRSESLLRWPVEGRKSAAVRLYRL